ncbi:MAG: type II toxin-antitoxin system Phd/YefM family antitoxin [Nitrospiraceae bacterium]|nr:type II toxin-antitoxin system Phd/YefM family antitoxin [Nitrospiraceae bacterium]
MKTVTVTIAEGKREFTRLIKEASEGDKDILVTKRGKPMAVIVAYDEYRHSKKMNAYRKILESREVFLKARVSADDVYKESRAELEGRR